MVDLRYHLRVILLLLHTTVATLSNRLGWNLPEFQLTLHRVTAKIAGKVELSIAVKVQKVVDDFRVSIKEELYSFLVHKRDVLNESSEPSVG